MTANKCILASTDFHFLRRHYRSWIHIVYYSTNLLMVIVRAMAVLKCASGIASAAKRPLTVLRRIPTDSWNGELQRLFDSISHDVVALSGGGFFALTKSLFLVVREAKTTLIIYRTINPLRLSLSRRWWELWPHMSWS